MNSWPGVIKTNLSVNYNFEVDIFNEIIDVNVISYILILMTTTVSFSSRFEKKRTNRVKTETFEGPKLYFTKISSN